MNITTVSYQNESSTVGTTKPDENQRNLVLAATLCCVIFAMLRKMDSILENSSGSFWSLFF